MIGAIAPIVFIIGVLRVITRGERRGEKRRHFAAQRYELRRPKTREDEDDPTLAFSLPGDGPMYCECTVPTTSWRCSFLDSVDMDTLEGAPSVITNIDGR